MLILDSNTKIKSHNTVVTIGKFDGFHEGHMKILRKVTEEKMLAGNFKSLAVSFTNHPDTLLRQDFKGVLMTDYDKDEFLSLYGFDYCVKLVFDEKLRDTERDVFFNEYIVGKWNAAVLVVGDDFSFGKGRQGNCEYLRERCAAAGIKLCVVERKMYKDAPISSSRIKEEVRNGNISEASEMLGYKLNYKGVVMQGNKIGRTLGFPTINIIPDSSLCLPKFGVYTSFVRMDDENGGYISYEAITNIGLKPTVGDIKRPIIESNLKDFDEEIYGREVVVFPRRFVRPEMKFRSLEELKAQIEKDKEEIR